MGFLAKKSPKSLINEVITLLHPNYVTGSCYSSLGSQEDDLSRNLSEISGKPIGAEIWPFEKLPLKKPNYL